MKRYLSAFFATILAGCAFGIVFAPKEYVDNLLATNLPLYLRNDMNNNESQVFGGYLSGFGFHADTGYNDNGWNQYTAHNGTSLSQSLPSYIQSNPWNFAKRDEVVPSTGGVFEVTQMHFSRLSVGVWPTNYKPIDTAGGGSGAAFVFGDNVATKKSNTMALGVGALNTNDWSFIWSGDANRYYVPSIPSMSNPYATRYNGGFHINPSVRSGMTNPLQNFWIGDTNLNDWIITLSPPTDVSGKQDILPYPTNAIPAGAIAEGNLDLGLGSISAGSVSAPYGIFVQGGPTLGSQIVVEGPISVSGGYISVNNTNVMEAISESAAVARGATNDVNVLSNAVYGVLNNMPDMSAVLSTNATGMVNKPVLGLFFARELDASPQNVKIYQPEMDRLAINFLGNDTDTYMFTLTYGLYEPWQLGTYPQLVMRYMDMTNIVPPMITAATNALAQSMGGTPAEITVTDTVPYSKGLVHLTVTSGGTLACNTNDWANGAQVMVDATLPATYTAASGIGPVGYSVLPSDGHYLLVFTRLGSAVYVSVITSVEE